MPIDERRSVWGQSGQARWVMALAVGLATAGSFGCRVTREDLRRWEKTQNGPDKLVAVFSHDKYEKDMRIEAAWSLVEMKKRGGQAVGLARLLDELNRLSSGERRDILAGLWAKLQPKVLQPIEAAGEGRWADPSVTYKDATFALYSDEKLDLDPKVRDEMTRALTEWSVGKDGDPAEKRLTSFEARMDNSAQAYGVEQVLRKLGLPAAIRLPSLLSASTAIKSQRLDTLARVVAEVKPGGADAASSAAYEKAREQMSASFAELLKQTLGDGYIKAVRAETEEALKRAPGGAALLGNAEAMKKYFDKVRDERLQQLFSISKIVGRKAVVDVLVALASDEKAQKEHRAFALAALEGNVDVTNDAHMKAFLAIAKGGAPDEVKHGALVRITAYSPDQAVRAYYDLFENPNWKVRYDGAMSVLGLLGKVGDKAKTTPKEFISKLPAKDGAKMGLGEPSSYGSLMAALPPALNAKATIDEALKGNSMGGQLTALGWYLSVGTPADLAILAKYETDKSPVPKCKDEDECGWDKPGCPVPKAGGEVEMKPVATIGDYVSYCVKPQIEARAKAPPPQP